MKIELKNKTRFRDDDLRAIVKEACKRAGVTAKRIVLDIGPSKRAIRGWASCTGQRGTLIWGTMHLAIPRFELWSGDRHGKREITREGFRAEVAQVALHEAMHLAGVHHKDMTEEQCYCRMPVPWADALPLREREERPREERIAAARADRLEHARAMLAKAVTRRKRATTIEKKWARRVKLMERA